MDAVARRARASKATLYRRWDDKPSLVVDAMVRAKQAPAHREPRHRLAARRPDEHVLRCARHGPQETHRDARRGHHGAVQRPGVRPPVPRDRSSPPRSPSPARSTHRAIERGEIPADVDIDIIAPALAGILLHRSFVLGLVPDDETVERVIDHVILPAVGHPDAAVLQLPEESQELMSDVTAAPPAPETGKTKGHARLGWALVLISVAQLMVVLDGTIVNIALPFIQQDLGHRPREPPVDRHRLRARLRQPAAARWPPRRPLRAPQGLHDRPGHLRHRLAARRPRHQRGPAARRSWPAGSRRRAGLPRRARADHHDVPGRARCATARSRSTPPCRASAPRSACCSVAG